MLEADGDGKQFLVNVLIHAVSPCECENRALERQGCSREKTVIRLFLADARGWARSALGERRII